MWLGQQHAYFSACPNLDYYLAPPPRQLKASLNSCPQQPRYRGQPIAATPAVAAVGLTVDVTAALMRRIDRACHQSNEEERNDEWAGYTLDLLNMLDMLPETHRNESIRVRYARSPLLPKKYCGLIFTQHKRYGDNVQTVPCPLFTKARTIGDEHALILPLNYDRHFGPSFDRLAQGKDGFMDFPFLDKISKVSHHRKKNKGLPVLMRTLDQGMCVNSQLTGHQAPFCKCFLMKAVYLLLPSPSPLCILLFISISDSSLSYSSTHHDDPQLHHIMI